MWHDRNEQAISSIVACGWINMMVPRRELESPHLSILVPET